jgi:hypothetical protein
VEESIRKADQEGKANRDENGLIQIPLKVDTRWIKRK